jgi:hypothetical protein
LDFFQPKLEEKSPLSQDEHVQATLVQT